MDACHVLLGRPWQFDRKTKHKRKENTYSFVWHNQKIVLIPQQGETNSTDEATSGKPVLQNVSSSKIHHDLKQHQTILALVLKENQPY